MMVDVAVVGAGPYGLSISSYLRAHGLSYRAFGVPMQTWRTQMPQSMFLKSEGFAASLYEPSGSHSLGAYCRAHGLPSADIGLPTSRELFCDYGEAFQRSCVPELEQVNVSAIAAAPAGFRLTLASGEALHARRVVLAVGVSHFAYLPTALTTLPREVMTHSSHHTHFAEFAGREVAVLGAGASAIDCAALLVQAGAVVHFIARATRVDFHNGPSKLPRPLMDRLRAPLSGLGPGWKSRLCTDAPLLFHVMPRNFRLLVVRKHLGPAPVWWTRSMVEGKVSFHLGQQIARVGIKGLRVRVDLVAQDGSRNAVHCHHMIAATGYRAEVARLPFLDPALVARLQTERGSPWLSRHFESSIPGLHFVGPAAANSFGPVARFAFGANFTALRLTRHLRSARLTAPLRHGPLGTTSHSLGKA